MYFYFYNMIAYYATFKAYFKLSILLIMLKNTFQTKKRILMRKDKN